MNEIQSKQLYHLLAQRTAEEEFGSYKFQGEWGLLDHIIVSGSLLNKDSSFHTDPSKADVFHDASILNINLQPEAIALKEVVIHPGRVYSQKDTIRYDLSEFTSSKDVYIKDVLKKLPGIDIDENGQVKYKGKAIDHYFVEGMDLTGGRYNQINNNLSAKAVKTAEIMEL